MATLEEQETIINYLPLEKRIQVYTASPPHIRRIQSDDRFTVTREYRDADGELEAIDATTQRKSHLNVLTVAQNAPVKLTDEQRQARAERLRKMRAQSALKP